MLSRSLAESIALCQRLAPEHAVCDNDAVAARLTRAGTVFVGALSAQACGDYVTGSNHVLPTSGAASARGGLSAADFVRVSSIQHIGRRALARIGPAAVALAEAEGLTAMPSRSASVEDAGQTRAQCQPVRRGKSTGQRGRPVRGSAQAR